MKTLGVIIADSYEYSPFQKWAEGNTASCYVEHGFDMLETEYMGCRIVAIKAGIGKVNAACATAKLITEHSADEIYNIGFSGAVHSVRRGFIVAGESCVECDFDLRDLGYKLGEKPEQKYIYKTDSSLLESCKAAGLMTVGLGTGDIFLTSEQTKAEYHEAFGISAFDMESAAIAAVCDRYGIPSLSIRKISDDSADSAVDDYRQMNESEERGLTDTLLSLLKIRYNG